jgi:hypothetical protein
MIRIAALTLSIATLTGCIFIDADDEPSGDSPAENVAPVVLSAEAGCYFDAVNNDDILELYATVDDANGLSDVQQVWADIYDEPTGELVQSLELFGTDDPAVWFSDWLVSTTLFDCTYPLWVVDFVAYDNDGVAGALAVYPNTYR